MSDPRPADSSVTRPVFDAVLTPHRSLTPFGFWLIMAGVVAISFTAGIAFLLKGAWPVFGFFGLDVALLYWAFRANFRSGRMYERVSLSRDRLTVQRVQPSGRSRTWSFQPYFLAVRLDDPEDHHCRLVVSERGREIVIGSFLTPQERADLADALKQALAGLSRPATR